MQAQPQEPTSSLDTSSAQPASAMTEQELETLVATFTSRGDIAKILTPGGIGAELGVAEGRFSARILESSKLSYLYSIDAWGDRGHDVNEYRIAFGNLHPYRARNTLLRMRFDEALPLFADAFFDFIYIDGYAHTGEDSGQTFRDWYPKLKPGGIMAGDDYHPSWPLVIEEVDKFSAANNLRLYVLNCVPEDDWASRYPTWFVCRPRSEARRDEHL